LREADLLVTLFTRIEGKVRESLAKRSRNGSVGPEPLTFGWAFYEDRERQELGRLDARSAGIAMAG
jgi:recombinational DNA repair protein (RecF pathway)